MAVQRTQAEIEHAAAIGGLQGTHGWREVEAEIAERQERLKQALLVSVLEEPNGDPIQREIDYTRGQLAALRWVLGLPKRQEGVYERSVSGHH